MTIPAEVKDKLAKPLNPARVHKREGGGGRQLSYLEAHDVIRAANDIFGIGEWSYETRELVCLGEEATQSREGKHGVRIAYRAIVSAQFNGLGFTDVGYGDAVEYTGSRLTPHELAAKEAVSDAVKRCLKNYGDQFGLCLYDKFAPEHRGAQAAPRVGADTGSSGRGGERPPSSPAHPPATPTDGVFRFPSGKHAGKTIEEAGASYCAWYLENGPRDDVKAAILAHTGQPDPNALPDDLNLPF